MGAIRLLPALAATSMEQGRVAACHMFGIDFKQKLADTMPIGIYTIPALSMVGVTEAEATEAGNDIVTGKAMYRFNARGRMLGDEQGLLKCVFERDSRRLIGACAVGEQATERNVAIKVNLPDGPLMARGLETRLAQVITNLLDNAVSFAPDGSEISISATRSARGTVRVVVEDQGQGIPEDNLESIFERFYSERPRAEAFGNHSGLGLSISKQIIEAHGGEIWAENIRPAGAVTAQLSGAFGSGNGELTRVGM